MSNQPSFRFNKKNLLNVAIPSPGMRATLHDTEVPGLQLRITDRGIKSFCVFRRSRRGAPERITIGRFPDLSAEHARVQARQKNRAGAGNQPESRVQLGAGRFRRRFDRFYG